MKVLVIFIAYDKISIDTHPFSFVSFAAFLPWSSCLPLKNILMHINNQHDMRNC